MNRLPVQPRCPNCQNILDGFSELEPGTVPKPGDVSVCLYCATVLEFTPEMQLRPADVSQLPKPVQRQCMKAVAIVRHLQASHARRN